jgi:L-alanine-DL-glutamate epimerase-like enolase superfamily enzyme
MRIAEVKVDRFRYRSQTVRDADGHGHPGEEHDAVQSMLTITSDDGVSGRYFGGINADVLEHVVKPVLIGEHPFYRERIWYALKERQRLNLSTLPDRVLTAVDLALWDLAGQAMGQPVHYLLGAARDSVPAYASTMVGDDLPGGLDTPQAYANYALQCKERGYPAFKLHTCGSRRCRARQASNATWRPVPPSVKRLGQTYR